MNARQLRAAAETLLALLDRSAPVQYQPGEAAAEHRKVFYDNINYVNRNAGQTEAAFSAAEPQSAAVVPAQARVDVLRRAEAGDTAASRRAGTDEALPLRAVPAPDGVTAEALGVWDPEGAMEDLDRFFRRDSRRYDSGFGSA